MIWAGAIFFPLLMAALCALPGPGPRAGFRLMFLAPLPSLFLAFAAEPGSGAELGSFLLKSSLGFGQYGNTFLVLTSLTWFAAALFISLGPRNSLARRSFCVMFLLTMCGNLGLAAARDAVSFYCFFALMTFCAFSLIVHSGKDPARRAGRIYLIMAVLGEGLLMAGIILSVSSSPSHYFHDIAPAMAGLPETHPVFLLLFAGFGIKAGLILLHFWLPLAHPAAPTPASAVLSGSIIKAGLLGWMNFFPLGLVSFGALGMTLAVCGLAGAFFGVMAGMSNKDPKTILAYSSISQMGLMTFCLGLGIWDQTLWTVAGPALFLLALNHALSKSALFLGVAVAGSKASVQGVKALLVILIGVPALALAGVPFTGGAQAKYLLKEVAAGNLFHDGFSPLLVLSSIFTTLLMAHFIRQMTAMKKNTPLDMGQAAVWLSLITLIICLPLIFYVFYPEILAQWMDPGFFLSSAWPVAAGVMIYLLLGESLEAAVGRLMRLLPDPAVLADKAWYHANARIREHGLLETGWARMNLARLTDQFLTSSLVRKASYELELKLSTWPVSGIIFILLVIILALLSLTGG
jgi:formate hydrogenlyase subunit 3/multisubunit Na+/H+ antiporter MnhD subunit